MRGSCAGPQELYVPAASNCHTGFSPGNVCRFSDKGWTPLGLDVRFRWPRRTPEKRLVLWLQVNLDGILDIYTGCQSKITSVLGATRSHIRLQSSMVTRHCRGRPASAELNRSRATPSPCSDIPCLRRCSALSSLRNMTVSHGVRQADKPDCHPTLNPTPESRDVPPRKP